MLSEEGLEDPRRFTMDRAWIIDPLDGTREYGEPGRSDWAVHIALWADGAFLAAAVSLPAIGAVFAADPAPTLPAVERERPILVTSRSGCPYAAAVVAHALDAQAVRLGSAGAKAMSVVNGETDIYVHDGGMYQWDSAAPAAALSPPASTSVASTAPRSSTTPATRGSPTSSSAARSGRSRSFRPLGRLARSGTSHCGTASATRWRARYASWRDVNAACTH